jgi:hypothetical protein
LAKVLRLCQLLSHSRFLLGYKFLNLKKFNDVQDIILRYKNALKVIFDKPAFIKFKISNIFKQDIDGTVLNQLQEKPYQSMNLKKLKKKSRNQKSQDFAKCSLKNLLPSLWIYILSDFHFRGKT